MEGLDAGGWLIAAKELRPMDIEHGQVGPGAAACVLVFDPGGPGVRLTDVGDAALISRRAPVTLL